METNIAILNGNGSHNLAHDTRSRLHLEGYNVVAINNFSNFVDRTVIYYRPDAERVATTLNKKFFPGAELESAPRLAASIDVKVVLGHGLGPQQQAEASKAHGLPAGQARQTGFRLKSANPWPRLWYSGDDKIV